MPHERDDAVAESIATVREACDEIEAAWADARSGKVDDDAWSRIETARNRLETAERRVRALLETRP